MPSVFKGKGVLITGATGSLGGAVLRRIMDDEENLPGMIRVFSRDETKQYRLRSELEAMYGRRASIMEYMIGDVRNSRSLYDALARVHLVIHAAALKHVPICEKNTTEAIETNIMGAENLVHAVAFHARWVEKVVALSTDKACGPFSLMGMTKAIQERIFASAVFRTPTPFVCVRMGNMIMSRGSIVPLFLDQISRGGPITITDPRMTRFFITLKQAADHVVTALEYAGAGQVYIPPMKAASIIRLAEILRSDRDIEIQTIGVRPGEKISDTIVSRDETPYLTPCILGGYLLNPQCVSLPEPNKTVPFRAFSSADEDVRMTDGQLEEMLGEALSSPLVSSEQESTGSPGNRRNGNCILERCCGCS